MDISVTQTLMRLDCKLGDKELINSNLPAVISVETTRRFSIMASLEGIKKSPPDVMQQTSCSEEI